MAYSKFPTRVDGVDYTHASDVNGLNTSLGTATQGRYYPQEHSAVGNGVADDSGALLSTDAANNGTGVTYVPAGTYALASSRTLAHALEVPAGALLQPATATTLALNGPLHAGPYQIFGGAGTVALGAAARAAGVRTEWFGAKWDGVTDDSAAIQAAITAAAGGTVLLPPGTALVGPYTSAGVTFSVPNATKIQGAGKYLTIFKVKNGVNATLSVFANSGHAGGTFPIPANDGLTFRDFTIDGNSGNQTMSAGKTMKGIDLWNTAHPTIEHVYVHDMAGDGSTEHFGIYVSGDNAGNSTTFVRINALIAACRVERSGSGIGLENLGGAVIRDCTALTDTVYQGFTVSGNGAGNSCVDVRIEGCLADGCQQGFEIENSSVALIGNVARLCQNAGIRLAAGATNCRVVGNEAYNNNQAANAVGSILACGIALDNTSGTPTNNVITDNRCYDNQGTPTQRYGVGQQTGGNGNLIANNHCAGNVTANTLNVLEPATQVLQSANQALTAAAATVGGLSATLLLDVDSWVSVTSTMLIDWTAGTGVGNVADVCQSCLRFDTVATNYSNISCVVAGAGIAQIAHSAVKLLAKGSHTIDVQGFNTVGARGQVEGGSLDIVLLNGLQ